MAPPKTLVAATVLHHDGQQVGRWQPVPDDWPRELRDELYEQKAAVTAAQAEKMRQAG